MAIRYSQVVLAARRRRSSRRATIRLRWASKCWRVRAAAALFFSRLSCAFAKSRTNHVHSKNRAVVTSAEERSSSKNTPTTDKPAAPRISFNASRTASSSRSLSARKGGMLEIQVARSLWRARGFRESEEASCVSSSGDGRCSHRPRSASHKSSPSRVRSAVWGRPPVLTEGTYRGRAMHCSVLGALAEATCELECVCSSKTSRCKGLEDHADDFVLCIDRVCAHEVALHEPSSCIGDEPYICCKFHDAIRVWSCSGLMALGARIGPLSGADAPRTGTQSLPHQASGPAACKMFPQAPGVSGALHYRNVIRPASQSPRAPSSEVRRYPASSSRTSPVVARCRSTRSGDIHHPAPVSNITK